MSKTNAIAAKNICKSYGKLKVLEGINLSVEKGTVLALLGPNGAGKTTMVKILSTLISADSGKASIEGYDVETNPDEVRKVIGLTGQYAAVDELLNGRENLRMMGRLYHLSKADTNRRAEELLDQFELTDAAKRSVKTYSGGMRRRLDLAASLIAQPPVVFLDEPTTGLDPRSRLAMWDIIKKLVAGGSTILLTTQYLEEADILADRIVVIDGGKVIAEGTSDELKGKVGKERAEFVMSNQKDFEVAKGIFSGKGLQVEEQNKSISLPHVGGVKSLRQMLEKLETSNIRVESLSLHKPTLDDVFMQLTGHEASKTEEEAKK
ncbi:MAG: ATP-binding cassette domain-containing protein [Patescibacteria group bacterium]